MTGLGQVGAVVQPVLLGAGQDVVERTESDVHVRVHEISLDKGEERHREKAVGGESEKSQSQLNRALFEGDIQ